MKKKLLTALLCATMLTTSTVTAFAAGTSPNTNTGGNTNIEVKGTYQAGTAGEKISVGVSWEEMSFTYKAAVAGEWDPKEHKYADAEGGSWSADTKKITVTNHSNVAVTAALSFKKSDSITGTITGTFTESSGTENDNVLELATAVGTDKDNAPAAVAEFGISGDAITVDVTLGTITVTIAKKAS